MFQRLNLTVFLTLILAHAAVAQPICGDRARIAERLRTHFSESRTALGQAQDGRIVEVFYSQGGQTWTVVVSRPGLPGCIVATGKGQRISLTQAVAFT